MGGLCTRAARASGPALAWARLHGLLYRAVSGSRLNLFFRLLPWCCVSHLAGVGSSPLAIGGKKEKEELIFF